MVTSHLELQIPAFDDRGIPARQLVRRILTAEGRHRNLRVTGFVFRVTSPLARVTILDGEDNVLTQLEDVGAVGFPAAYALRLDEPLPPLRSTDRYSLLYLTASWCHVNCQLTALPQEHPL